ncbi:MAG: hypothetical protein DME45_09675 [Verrucomicrobia bacterium]|nr:MAG: hypothetical protein DME45_09675 [Verrucomicrobiota bacterium]
MIAHKDDVLQIKNAALRYRPADGAATPPQAKGTPPPGGRAGAGRERKNERTVYVLSGGQPKPALIKTGISDGVVSEVLEGLKEGERVVIAGLTSATSSSPATNPFGPSRRFP